MSAEVYLWQPQGKMLVGRLIRIPGGDQSIFMLDENYLSMPSEERPMLSFSFLGADGFPRQQTRITKVKIHPWLSNLLPEGYLRQYVADQHGFHKERDFPLIVALGGDLPGGVMVESDAEAEITGNDTRGD